MFERQSTRFFILLLLFGSFLDTYGILILAQQFLENDKTTFLLTWIIYEALRIKDEKINSATTKPQTIT